MHACPEEGVENYNKAILIRIWVKSCDNMRTRDVGVDGMLKRTSPVVGSTNYFQEFYKRNKSDGQSRPIAKGHRATEVGKLSNIDCSLFLILFYNVVLGNLGRLKIPN